MFRKTIRISLGFLLVTGCGMARSQTWFPKPLSPRIANYAIAVTLDEKMKMLHGVETLVWRNPSKDPVTELRFHLYLNAFKNNKSTFLRESGGRVIEELRDNDGWGWVTVDRMQTKGGEDLTRLMEFIHPDDNNVDDRTVFRVPLDPPLRPGATIALDINFTAKLPVIIARTGYNHDFFMVAQWFPKIGVYETSGMRYATKNSWNCHQFHETTEFYADYGVYDVKVTVPATFVVGAVGTNVGESTNGDGTKTLTYHAEDVHDFSWTASPLYTVINDQWEGVQIHLLMQPDRVPTQAGRYLQSAKAVLSYFDRWIGRYPYPTLTIVDPQWNALRAGGMEYPTLITGGSLWGWPEAIKYIPEGVVVHEFGHQYWYGLVGSNEFEEAWLDEGINQYSETRIMDTLYGSKTSIANLFGIREGDMEFSRSGYTRQRNPKIAPTFTKAWEYTAGGYGEMTYDKSALFLATLERLIGRPVMDEIMRTYFERWKFRHPSSRDFIAVVNDVVPRRLGTKFGKDMNWFFDQVLYGTDVCDYELTSISNSPVARLTGIVDSAGVQGETRDGDRDDGAREYRSTVLISRLGEIRMPVDILVHFSDGKEVRQHWNGQDRYTRLTFNGHERVVWAIVDPDDVLLIDINRNNNSMTVEPATAPLWKYTVKMLYWVQNILLSAAPF